MQFASHRTFAWVAIFHAVGNWSQTCGYLNALWRSIANVSGVSIKMDVEEPLPRPEWGARLP
jgi:hypothetical protein